MDTKELRIKRAPLRLHAKIEKYIAKVLSKEDRVLTKETGAIELLEKATRNIQVPL